MKLTEKFQNSLRAIRKIPEKKHYIEFITATLSIPVLLTVIILNLNSLRSEKTDAAKEQPSGEKQVVVTYKPESSTASEKKSADHESCVEEVGPVTILTPDDGEVISESPVDVSISYDNETYCAVVWSYRINDGKWSAFDDKSIALYNLPKGEARLELRIKSIASGDEKLLKRNFKYNGPSGIEPTAVTEPTSTPGVPTPTVSAPNKSGSEVQQ